MSKTTLYFAVNLGFALLVAVGGVVHPEQGVHLLYLLLLLLLCSSPLLDLHRLNDRHALVLIFCANYFMLFGFLDLAHLLVGSEGSPHAAVVGTGILSQAELVILAGGGLALLSYRLTCEATYRNAVSRGVQRCQRAWPEGRLIIISCLLWIVCTWLSWRLKVYIIVDNSIANISSGLASMSPVVSMIYMLATYMQPLGIVMLAYAQCRYKHRYLTVLLAAAIVFEMIFGFIIDVKGQVFIGLVLVALTKLLVDGKVPKARLALVIVLLSALYPLLQANRAVRGEYGIDHTQAAQQLGHTVALAISARKEARTSSEHVETFYERGSLKGSVELIVSKTGSDVPYQHGYTLQAILLAFIPRAIWPSKPDVQTGRVMNHEFHISDQEATYISPSHLGELYWNFGWPGVLLGMPMIGALLGYIGGKFDLSRSASLTTILVLMATAKLLILGFESAIAPQYVTWLRSMGAIGILHYLFTRPAELNGDAPRTPAALTAADSRRDEAVAFPNLMR